MTNPLQHRTAFSLAVMVSLLLVASSDLHPATYETRYVNGTAFVVGSEGDVQVWVALFRGSTLQAVVYVVNGSNSSFTFYPHSIQTKAIKMSKGKRKEYLLRTYSASDYEKKIRTQHAIAAGLYAGSASLANQPQPSSSSFSGHYYGSSGYGSYTGTITTWPTAADYAAANARTQAQVSAMAVQLGAAYQALTSNLMRTHTLLPSTYYGGVVHIKKKRAQGYEVSVPLGQHTFGFSFNVK